jgi:hypothetical protein
MSAACPVPAQATSTPVAQLTRQQVGEPMRARLVSLVVRPTAPPVSVGLAVAALLIVAETLALYPLKVCGPESAPVWCTCWAWWW